METMPFAEDRNAIFARLEETAARANLTKEERELYEEQWRYYNDYYNVMDYAVEQSEKKGYDVGLAKGLADGRAEGIEQVAKMMKSQGLVVDLIVQCTGLSPDEIAKL